MKQKKLETMVSYPPNGLVSTVIDEVALEGLDGITLEALWQRLSHRLHDLLPVRDAFKEQVWSICLRVKDFSYYQLKDPRGKLVIFNRYEFVDPDLGTILEPEVVPEDLYPHCPVDDVENNTKGSCSTYYTRKDVSGVVKTLSVHEAEEQYATSLVIVASQALRENALLGDAVCPMLELNILQYCFLERVGRSRYHGEVTQGKLSLNSLKEDPKSLFYYRKFLLRHKLLTKQIHHQKSSGHCYSGSLLHLPRFYIERKPKMIYLAEQIVQILKSKKNYVAEYDEIRKKLQLENPIRKLFKMAFFQRVVKTDLRVPYRTLYPNAADNEWRQKNNPMKERTIRAVQLLDPDMDITEIWGKDDIGDDEDPYELDISEQKFNIPLLKQANVIVESMGPDGVTQSELAKKMGVIKLHSRTILRNLVKINIVAMYMDDMGRQRVTKHVSKKFEKGSRMSKQFQEEMHKIKKFTRQGSTEEKSEIPLKSAEKTVKISPTEDSGELKEAEGKSVTEETEEKLEENGMLPPESNEEAVGRPALVENIFNAVNEILIKYNLTKYRHKYRRTFLNLNKVNSTGEKLDLAQKSNIGEVSRPASDRKRSGDLIGELSDVETSDRIKATTFFNSIEAKLVEQKPLHEKEKTNEVVGFIEELQNNEKKGVSNITYRLLKRANMIIESVKEHKVIADITKVLKMIDEEEDKEGYDVKIDKKSLIRLLQKLAKDNLLKNIKLTLSANGKEKCLTFICDPSISIDHTVIQSAVEQAKIKFCLLGSQKVKGAMQNRKHKDSERPATTKRAADKTSKEKHGSHNDNKVSAIADMKYDNKEGKRNGYSPKFVRMQTLHMYLFYLVYEHPGEQNASKDDQLAVIRRMGFAVDETLAKEMETVYALEVGWKMFIPPLPKHNGWPKGWTLMCDVLLRMPLSIFLKLHNVTFIIPGLDYYVNHAIRKHFLVKSLPANLRNALLNARRYIFSIHETVTKLCYVGLLQFGPQKLKEKDQVFVYLNRRAELLDTTSSAAGYHKIEDKPYPMIRYTFDSMQIVEKYWYDMWNICINTFLGDRLSVQGKDIILEDLTKKTAMVRAVKARSPREAYLHDVGFVPGDRRGAAGIDSAFFPHLKRNWNWSYYTNNQYRGEARGTEHNQRVAYLSKIEARPLRFTEFDGLKKASLPIARKTVEAKKWMRQRGKKDRGQEENTSGKKTPKHRMIIAERIGKQKSYVRRVLPRKKPTRHRLKYDEVDFCALQQMDKLRVDWEPREDSILLVCKVAMVYLCPNPRKQRVTFTAVRDVLRSYSEISYNKTSRACQRRLLYMLRRPQTVNSVSLGVEEVKQNYYINQKFGGIMDKIKKECEDPSECDERISNVFKDLVEYIAKKYYDIADFKQRQPIVVPKTIQELNLLYKLIHPTKPSSSSGFAKGVKNLSDIHVATVNSVIHSSMCCSKDRTSWELQLFKVYQQYPESLLRSAMAMARADHMVTMKKNYMCAIKKYGNCMPMSSSQYQLNTSYIYKFQTKWPYEIFRESYDLLCKLTKWYGENQSKDSNYAVPDDVDGVEVSPVTGGVIIGTHDYLAKGQLDFDIEIPDQIITLDPRLQEKDETYQRIAKRYQDILMSLEQLNVRKRRDSSIDLVDPEVEEEYEMDRRKFEDKVVKQKREKEDRERSNYWNSRNDETARMLEESEIRALREVEDRERTDKRQKFDGEMVEKKRKYQQVLEWGAENVPEAMISEFRNSESSKGDADLEGLDSEQDDSCDADDDVDENHTIRFQNGTTIMLTAEDIEHSASDVDEEGGKKNEDTGNGAAVSRKRSRAAIDVESSAAKKVKLSCSCGFGKKRLKRCNCAAERSASCDSESENASGRQEESVSSGAPEQSTSGSNFRTTKIATSSCEDTTNNDARIVSDISRKRTNETLAEDGAPRKSVAKRLKIDSIESDTQKSSLNKKEGNDSSSLAESSRSLQLSGARSEEDVCNGEKEIAAKKPVDDEFSANLDNKESKSDSSSKNIGRTRVNDLIKGVFGKIECGSAYGRSEELNDMQKRCTRIALLMMREELNDLALSDSHHAHEYFVVNTCRIFHFLRLPPNGTPRRLEKFLDHEVPAEILPLKRDRSAELFEKLKKFAYFPKSVTSYADFRETLSGRSNVPRSSFDAVYEYVRAKNELGATLQQLVMKFSAMPKGELSEILSFLTTDRLFLRSGIKKVHYIQWEYADPWLIRSYKITRYEKEALSATFQKGAALPKAGEKTRANDEGFETDEMITEDFYERIIDATNEWPSKHTRSISSTEENTEEKPSTSTVATTACDDMETLGVESNSSENTKESDSPGKEEEKLRRSSRLQEMQEIHVQEPMRRSGIDTSEEIKVAIRPWIRIDGAVNRRVLDRMMGAVLNYCTLNPGISLAKIQSRFVPALQPFHTRELVEMLVRLECLELNTLKKPRVTLFSKPAPVKIGVATDLESEEELIVHSVIDATSKFGMFLGNRTYAVDFLS